MATEKLRIFIGSSLESSPVLDIIASRLRANKRFNVTTWTKLDAEPGSDFLDVLITASSTFDAAVLVFAPDDLVISRGREQKGPRDNVIFELGLFMGNLGRKRALIVGPNEWETDLKIMSDIGHLGRTRYKPPQYGRSMKREQKQKLLEGALKPACDTLESHLEQLEPRQISRGPRSLGILTSELIQSLASSPTPGVKTIRNIALDMAQTWPIFRDEIFADDSIRNVRIDTLMIDSQSPPIRAMSSGTVSIRKAREQEQDIVGYGKKNARLLAARKIAFSCRAYSDTPLVHGFLLNRQKLLLSLCSVEKGKLVGAPNPYLQFEYHESRDRTGRYLFSAFNAWFDFRWSRARVIWPGV